MKLTLRCSKYSILSDQYIVAFYSESMDASAVQKMKFSVKDFFSKCEQIHRKLWICSHLVKKSLSENFTFCAMTRGVSPLCSCIQSISRNMLTRKLSLLISIFSSVIITNESDFEKITD